MIQQNISLKEFKRDDENPLECQLLVSDETSMIDAQLMHSLLKAAPKTASIAKTSKIINHFSIL